jgi:hypothetical protein
MISDGKAWDSMSLIVLTDGGCLSVGKGTGRIGRKNAFHWITLSNNGIKVLISRAVTARATRRKFCPSSTTSHTTNMRSFGTPISGNKEA